MTQTQSLFSRFAFTQPEDNNIGALRKDFTSTVCKIAAESTSKEAFRAELNQQLSAANLPTALLLRSGAERSVYRLPVGLVAKVEHSTARKPVSVETSANFAEWNAGRTHPAYLPTMYGHHGHVSASGELVSVLLMEEILPLDVMFTRFGRIAVDAKQLRNVGVRIGSGELLIADGGDYVGTKSTIPATPYGRDWSIASE